MAFKDFRDYLDSLERQGMLVRVTKEVSPRFEIAAGIRKVSDTNGPALLFENVAGHPDWRVAGGLFATPRLMAFALQTEENEDKLMKRYLEFSQQRLKPILVSSGPVKEVIIKGDDVDLTKLPVPTYCEHDAGPYLTAGVEIGRHPTTGVQNASIHRRQILGKNKLGLMTQAPDLRLMIQAAEEQGQSLGIATAIGVHPALTIASALRVPTGVDETEIAGALRGEPIEMVKCETIDVQVPADAEMVIEGIVVPDERITDGPFGEFPGNYISLSNWKTSSGKYVIDAYVVKVTAITMRKDAIFQAMLTGMPLTENHCLRKWASAASIYRLVTRMVPFPEDIRGVNFTVGGTGHRNVVISLHKRAEPTARNIIYSVLATAIMVGFIIVVDEDIDVYNPVEVEWAITTRVRPDRDIIILPPVAAQPEAAVSMPTHMYKWGIDATAPLTKEPWLYKKAVPPGVDKVDYV